MKSSMRITLSVFLILAGVSTAHAIVSLPDVLSDGMVLQQNQKVPIWGKADPGETVVVKFAGRARTATASADGTWLVKLDPIPANARPRRHARLRQQAQG